jgi:DNA-directed RNA polymerase specialized sigma24 family protein
MIDWQGILSRDGPAVWRTAWRVLGNRADADECFQEAFVAALEYSSTHTVKHWRALLQRLAAARAIVFWCRTKDKKGYRAVYGDLHAADVKAADLPKK